MALGGDSPTSRALRALAAVQDRPGITATELGEQLGVTDRAARRYIAILREADIPVESTPGRYGGYRIGRGFRPPPLTFTMAEALGLTMAAVESHHGRDDAAGHALSKLTRVLPAGLATAIEALRSVASPSQVEAEVDMVVVAQLAEATSRRRRVDLRYSARTSFRTSVDPWGVVPRRGYWYLLCWSHERQARRLYRVDRISDVRIEDAAVETTPGLDPATVVEEHLSEGWDLAVEVVVDAPLEQVRWWLPRQLGRLEPTEDGSTRLVGTTSSPDWYAIQLAEIGAPFRVLSPPELAAEVRRLAERLREAAGPDTPAPDVGSAH